jgi:hypothetical protein
LSSEGSTDKPSVTVVGVTQTTPDVVDAGKEQREIGEKFAALESQVLQKLAEFETSSLKSQQATAKGQKIMTWATVIIAATTIAYAVTSYFQLRSMNDTGNDTHDLAVAAQNQSNAAQYTAIANLMQAMQAIRFADAAKISANNSDRIARGSEDAVKATQASMRLDQRAWITLDTPTGDPVAGETFSPKLPFRNSGRTPARNLTSSITLQPSPTAEGPNLNIHGKTIDTPSNGLLTPNQSFTSIARLADMTEPQLRLHKVTDSDMAAIHSDVVRFYLYGRINYDDVFRCHHWISYCWVYRIDPNRWQVCKEGNDIDENRCQPSP